MIGDSVRVPDSDHDIADLLASLHVPVGRHDPVQRVPPVDDGLELP